MVMEDLQKKIEKKTEKMIYNKNLLNLLWLLCKKEKQMQIEPLKGGKKKT